ncbi:MAG: right-handed parallel beta-helix repeat-containing protein [Phycisphaerales bacterium]|nr:MAG: right-handed parallel beta-helix repeat-containing protein [Phycisphaerales bacterium]
MAAKTSINLFVAGVTAIGLSLAAASPAVADEIHVYEGESIQAAIDGAAEGDEVIVHPGTYYERIDFIGKGITLRSEDPYDSDIVASTVIDGGASGTVITCSNGEGPDSFLGGLTITNGEASSGGGMLNLDSSPTVSRCVFVDNSAAWGGGICNQGGSPTVIACTFTDNSASYGDGGGMFNSGDSSIIVNCSLAGNAANYGGGIASSSSASTICNCTFTGNTANVGAGICTKLGSPLIVNCILWGDIGTEISCLGGDPEVRYCNVQGGYGGNGNIDADPMFADPDVGDFHLSPGSPCIDAGDNTAVPDGVMTDLDGKPRFLDDEDTEDTGFGDPPIVDMGAYELHVESDDNDNDGIPNNLDNCPYHSNPDQADCDEDGIGDVCAIAYGYSEDCNENGIPDECDIDSGFSDDYDLNGVPDECDPDCNDNGVPDACDIDCTVGDCAYHPLGCGASYDYDLNGVPDECDPDCNGNGIPDACDVECAVGDCASHPLGCGTSYDFDDNGIPDECQQLNPLSQNRYVYAYEEYFGWDNWWEDEDWIFAPDFGPFDVELEGWATVSQTSNILSDAIVGTGSVRAEAENLEYQGGYWENYDSRGETYLSVTFELSYWSFMELTGNLSYDCGSTNSEGRAVLLLSGTDISYVIEGGGDDQVTIDHHLWLAPDEYTLEVSAYADEPGGNSPDGWWLSEADFSFQMHLMPESPCPPDLNGDLIVDIEDLFLVMGAWGACDGCPHDLNDDGKVNIDDLFYVLNHWGPCP